MSADPTAGILVSLEDILEVRAGPLYEEEILSIMVAAIEPLQHLVSESYSCHVTNIALWSTAVFILPNGSIRFLPVPLATLDSALIPLEFQQNGDSAPGEEAPKLSEAQTEKLFVYFLGAVLNRCLTYGGEIASNTGPDLLSLINMMMIKNSAARPSLSQFAQIAQNQAAKRQIDTKQILLEMYTIIMGAEDISVDEETFHFTKPLKEAVKPVSNEIIPQEAERPAATLHSLSNGPSAPPLNQDATPPLSNGPKSMYADLSSSDGESVEEEIVDYSRRANVEETVIPIRAKQDSNSSSKSPINEVHVQQVVAQPSLQATDHLTTVNAANDKPVEQVAAKQPEPSSVFENVPLKSEENEEVVAKTHWTSFDDELDAGGDKASRDKNYENGARQRPSFAEKSVVAIASDPFDGFEPFEVAVSANAASPFEEDEFVNEFVEGVKHAETVFIPPIDYDLKNEGDFNEFTQPKVHGRMESLRAHHSVDCQYCSADEQCEKHRADLASAGGGPPLKSNRKFSEPRLKVDPDREVEGLTARRVPAEVRDSLRLLRPDDLNPAAGADGAISSDRFQQSKKLGSFSLNTPTDSPRHPPRFPDSEPKPGVLVLPVNCDDSDNEANDELPAILKKSDFEERKAETPPLPLNRDDAVSSEEPAFDAQNASKPSPFRRSTKRSIRLSKRGAAKASAGSGNGGEGASSFEVTAVVEPLPSIAEPSITPSPRAKANSFGTSPGGSGATLEQKQRSQSHHDVIDRKGSVGRGVSKEEDRIEVDAIEKANERLVDDALRDRDRQRAVTRVVNNECLPQQNNALPNRRFESNNGAAVHQGMTGPEFLHKTRMPSIRLKALTVEKRSTLFRHSHASNVLVILLNGQRIDVSCRTATTAGEVFDAVVAHTNLTEHHFFGLTYLRDGEHYFLETDEKLSKVAPPGWKEQTKLNLCAKLLFTLYLRLKCYPITLEFIRNPATMHQLYLQLRRDLIDERLRGDREASCTLAALALQAEYGDRPDDKIDYFQLDHYLPHRHLLDEPSENERLSQVLAEIHMQYGGLNPSDAEIEFIKQCQKLREYGIHFHRLFKTKPSHHLIPTPLGDPETGVPLWIGIMPKGVIIFEEKSGDRIPISQHPWQTTQALQFDRKKFKILQIQTTGSEQNEMRVVRKHVYYTDHFKKSGYFVHFAEAQHRFSLKMKNWLATLATMTDNGGVGVGLLVDKGHPRQAYSQHSRNSSNTDSGISREASPDAQGECHFGGNASSAIPSTSSTSNNGFLEAPKARGGPRKANNNSSAAANVIGISLTSRDQTFNSTGPASGSLQIRFDNLSPDTTLNPSDYELLSVELTKDARLGLGLTLVDGEIQGLRGVYIKSLTPGGPAELNGNLRIGDRLIGVNDESLEGRSRHDAVELVRQATGAIRMNIMRLKSMYSSSESITETDAANSSNNRSSTSGIAYITADIESGLAAMHRNGSQDRTDSFSGGGKADSAPPKAPPRKHSTVSGASSKHDHIIIDQVTTSTPSARNRGNTANSMASQNSFDAAGASRTTEDLVLSPILPPPTSFSTPIGGGGHVTKDRRGSNAPSGGGSFDDGGARINSSAAIYGGLNNSSSDESDNEHDANEPSFVSNSTKPPPSYLFGDSFNNMSNDLSAAGDDFGASSAYQKMVGTDRRAASADRAKGASLSRSENLDWTDELDMEDVNQFDWLDDGSVELELVEVKLVKNERGSLGIKIAGGKGQRSVYVKELVAEPAISSGRIRVGDRIVSVNGHDTFALSHHEVVELLKRASSPVTLGLSRPKEDATRRSSLASTPDHLDEKKSDKVIEVTLEKPASGSLGLSLAKRGGDADGIFIRVITPGSVAALDKRLMVGDRLWEINGSSVELATPQEVVEKLKSAIGSVHIVVKRPVNSGVLY